jgi:hypothetical protein
MAVNIIVECFFSPMKMSAHSVFQKNTKKIKNGGASSLGREVM